MDQASGVPFKRLNWPAYEASGPTPAPRRFTAVVLENDTLQLTVLPELGGRLYRAIHKPTGRDVFYLNPVLKPTRWGPAQQGWWLAAGGLEWAFPVDEHGLEWGTPWEYATSRTANGVAVTLWDSRAADRLRAKVTIGLPDGGAGFTLAIVLENPTSTPRRYQFWINAMLSGPGNRVSAETSFLLPTDQVIVHSTDDLTLPPPRGLIPWPNAQGRDLTRYANWRGWLGIFAVTPAGRQGAYDATSKLGILRTYPPEVARGAKLFAGKGLSPNLWTDDGSTYFELWGGPNRTFFPEDDLTLAPAASLEWTETWTVITSPPGP
jgi:hypothetical protein